MSSETDEITKALRQRYPAPSWALLFEVPNATGANARRRADAIAIGLWPSRGLVVLGFEIKIRRGDWLRERSNPAKAEPLAAHCDEWWLVAPDHVVEAEEVPPRWGLLRFANGKLRSEKPPSDVEHRTLGPLDRGFAIALLRNACQQLARDVQLEKLLHEAREAARKEALDEYAEQIVTAERRAASSEKLLAEMGQLLGTFDAAKLGPAIRALRSLGSDYGALKTLRASIETIGRECDALEAFARSLEQDAEKVLP